MDCQEVQKFIHAYLDGEFEDREGVAIAAHLEICQVCKNLAQFEGHFRRCLKKSMMGVVAPSSLRVQLQKALVEAEKPESWPRRWLWRLIPAAAAALLLVGVMFSKHQELAPPSSLVEQSVEWHRLQLPMDIRGSSPELVQRFFSDKVPFAVRPPTFASRQAQLMGARLSNLSQHQAVYLAYDVGGKRVSVFIFDSHAVPSGGARKRVGQRNVFWQDVRGYNVAMYTSGGTGYAVTSDMDPQRLGQLIAHSQE